MPWKPSHPGEVPTLGYGVLDWMSEVLAAPDRVEYEPFVPTSDQARFVLRLYELDPVTGRRKRRRAVYSRPKGTGKSPFLGAVLLAECMAEVVPDGWDAYGQPVARTWAEVRTPWGQVMAVSEDQTKNAFLPMLEMLRSGPACDLYPGLEPLEGFINLPRGKIEPVTASAASREGNRPICCIFDQTESWTPTNGGVRLAATARRNLGKTNGLSIEAPNAYVPGMDSVAQASAEYARTIAQGKARDEGLLYDHREAPPETDLADRESLLRGLAVAYGDAADVNGGWVDLDRIVAEIWSPDVTPESARQFYLNQVTHASDSWLSSPEWGRCAQPGEHLADRDMACLGFDGSVRDDSTALVACRVHDGFLELLDIWEPREFGGDRRVDTAAVDAAVHAAFERFQVIGFYADPPLWQGYVDAWTAKYGERLKVRQTTARPIEWWTNRPTPMVAALERFHSAVLGGELAHGEDVTLTAHVLNARRRIGRAGVAIAKEHPKSARKVDAAMAAVLAFECRSDAVAQGVLNVEETFVPIRIR
jgi:phage terminase large subunit-like protein